MRSLLFVLALAPAPAPAPLVAQSRAQPDLILSIYGGVATGNALWQVNPQLLPLHSSTPSERDTVQLTRRANSAIAAGLIASLFRSAHLGFSLEVAFRTLSFDDTCAPRHAFLPDPPPEDDVRRNRILCDNITASGNSGSVLALVAGLVARGAPRGVLSPYLRAGAALSHTTISSVATSGIEPDSLGGYVTRSLVVDGSPRRVGFGATVGAGMTAPLGTGYQIRVEVRDQVATHQRLDGPANALGSGPVSSRVYHYLGLIIGLDVVLEQKRGRRY